MNFDKISFSLSDEDVSFIPLIGNGDDESTNIDSLPESLPILPLRNMVLFPSVISPVTAGRDKSIQLLDDANKGEKFIGVVAQRSVDITNPNIEDLYEVGAIAKIIKIFKMPNGNTTAILQGRRRFRIKKILSKKPYLRADIEIIKEPVFKRTKEFVAMIDAIKDLSLQVIREDPNIPTEATLTVKNIENDTFLINFITSSIIMSVSEKQKFLEESNIRTRAMKIMKTLDIELQKIKLKNKIQKKVKVDLDQQHKEYLLHQEMKTIQEELGVPSYDLEIEELSNRAKKKKWSPKIEELFDKELSKYQRMNPHISEHSIQRNYLETLLDLPWEKYSKDSFNLSKSQKILDKNHYGLEDVKDRIIEYMAVIKLKGDMRSPILCLYGPPGVGKTSLGKSVATALGRKYARMSLGGLRDEAEIRGHRKTYIGAMPGRIIQSIKKAKTSNPVFVLDEIDKLSASHNGDPSSALLEVLDPEQNSDFYDNFLEVGYDLSKVLFIATANDLSSIHPALLDRMEIIDVNGYTVEEKIEIAKKHLLPKQIKEHGLKKGQLNIKEKEFEAIIDGYTRESGVRNLEKKIAKIARSIAKHIASDEEYNVNVSVEDINKILGPSSLNRDKYQDNEIAGVVTGLTWSSVGGDILFIESSLSKGKGKLSITGNLGDVMKESATIALQYIKSNSDNFGIDSELFSKYDIHIHVPEGAIPKEGPSAGITLLTSLMSLFSQRKVKSQLAMTGEITLRGKVLPVGGIKEKILAAKRAGIKDIILCKDNKKDIERIKEFYLKGLKFHYVDEMSEVIDIALLKRKVKNAKEL
ncbi:endopeptidase La [Ichthyobacterium seriolicida]|uniref:Lon protease n=1 Tax=Ichthyobacterium seriolicida TaxID=242600 RepID=A0A1J1DWK0_9FLAO|nr:endopeptidase La [Ichthyobacterium seriolicida]BAV94234.1 ATP-dependent protease [Ichthyobacterium seriolicida]